MLALFATLLSRYSGQDDVVIGTPFAGRNRTELESMVGYFINPLALRVDLSGDPTFSELLVRARETTLEAFAERRRSLRDGRAGNQSRARPEPDAGLPGDDRLPQPRVAGRSGRGSSPGHPLHRDHPTRRDGRSSTCCWGSASARPA